jgi:hypothetical protein
MFPEPLAYFVFTSGSQLLRITKTEGMFLDEGNRHGIFECFVVYFDWERLKVIIKNVFRTVESTAEIPSLKYKSSRWFSTILSPCSTLNNLCS